jgi:hypothetical protein
MATKGINNKKISLIKLRNERIINSKYNSHDFNITRIHEILANVKSNLTAKFKDLLTINDEMDFLKKLVYFK